MSKPIVGIVGYSGTGKSTSYSDLPPEKTIIIDVERKGLPFNSKPFAGRIHEADTYLKVITEVQAALKDPTCEYLVVDSFSKFLELLENAMTSSFTGYDIWKNYNKRVGEFLEMCKNNKTVVILLALDEILKLETPEGGFETKRRIKTQGKKWEGKLETEFLMVLYTKVVATPQKCDYYFETQTDSITSGKTPAYLELPRLMPNKLGALFTACNKKWAEL